MYARIILDLAVTFTVPSKQDMAVPTNHADRGIVETS